MTDCECRIINLILWFVLEGTLPERENDDAAGQVVATDRNP
jgi:hypothetical protein